MFHGTWDIDGFSCWEVVLAIEAIGKEEDARSIDLVIDDGDVAVVISTDAEGDGLSLGVAALSVGGSDLEVEVFVDLLDPALDFGLGGGALLDGLGGDGDLGLGLLPGVGGPDAGGDFGGGDDGLDLADLAAVEVGDLGVDGEVRRLVVEASSDDALDALDLDLLGLGAGLDDVLGLELALVLEVGEAFAGDDLEFAGFRKGHGELVLQHGGVGGEHVGVLVEEVPHADIDLAIAASGSRSLREGLC